MKKVTTLPVRQPRAVSAVTLTILAIGWMLSPGPIGDAGQPVWAQGPALTQVEVRPQGAAEADAIRRLPTGTAAAVKKTAPSGARVEQYLFVKLDDATLLVGVDPVNAPARTLRGTFRSKLVAGRGFRADDRDKIVAIVGKQYAESHKTAAGYKIAEMVYPGHTPGLMLGKTRVEVVGIFDGGSADADQLVLVPLALAQTLGDAPEAASLVTVTLRSAADAEAVKKTLDAELKDKVDVRVRK
jgi:hypothetical protein